METCSDSERPSKYQRTFTRDRRTVSLDWFEFFARDLIWSGTWPGFRSVFFLSPVRGEFRLESSSWSEFFIFLKNCLHLVRSEISGSRLKNTPGKTRPKKIYPDADFFRVTVRIFLYNSIYVHFWNRSFLVSNDGNLAFSSIKSSYHVLKDFWKIFLSKDQRSFVIEPTAGPPLQVRNKLLITFETEMNCKGKVNPRLCL